MRRRVVVIVASLTLAVLGTAYLPANIENAVKSWFNSASKLTGFRFSINNNPPAPTTGKCDFYMSATGDLVGSCNGQPASTIISSSVLGCLQSNGVMSCIAFVSADQNSLPTPAVNYLKLFDNDVDLTPSPSCADYGQDGLLTLLDIDESAADTYVLCNSLTEVFAFPTQAPALYVNANLLAGTNTAVHTANLVRCTRYQPPFTKTLTKYTMSVTIAGGASQTAALCVYNDADAGTLISDMGRVDITGTNVVTSSAATAFTLRAGTVYRVCTTTADTSATFLGGVNNTLLGNANVPVLQGTAANASTGTTSTLACPATTGALTRITSAPAQIVLQ